MFRSRALMVQGTVERTPREQTEAEMFDARFPGMAEQNGSDTPRHLPRTAHVMVAKAGKPRPAIDFEDDDATNDKGAEMARIVKELKDSGLQPVSLRELRQTFGAEREGWRGAFETELSSFDTHSCFRRADPEEKVEIYRPGSGWEVLPAKVVAGLKPPERRRAEEEGTCSGLRESPEYPR